MYLRPKFFEVRATRWRAMALAVTMIAPVAACRETRTPRPLEPAAHGMPEAAPRWESAEALAREALAALEARDKPRLEALCIDETEYREEFWPDFVRTKHRNTIPVEFQWNLLQMNTGKGLRRVLADFGGRSFELEAVVPESITDYGSFQVWNRVRLEVVERGQTQPQSIKVFGSLFEAHGRFLAFGYSD